MSLEDKREMILTIFHETKVGWGALSSWHPAHRSCLTGVRCEPLQDVYVLKDVEKLASKRGVVLQSVKDVLQGLVDDDLVKQEKIGVSNFFWSFPSDAAVKLRGDQERLERRLQVGPTALVGGLPPTRRGRGAGACLSFGARATASRWAGGVLCCQLR